jgi:hypothetical protein
MKMMGVFELAGVEPVTRLKGCSHSTVKVEIRMS